MHVRFVTYSAVAALSLGGASAMPSARVGPPRVAIYPQAYRLATGPRLAFVVSAEKANSRGASAHVRSFALRRPRGLKVTPAQPGATLGQLRFQVADNSLQNRVIVPLVAARRGTVIGSAHGARVVLNADRLWFIHVTLPGDLIINPVLTLRGAGLTMLGLGCGWVRFRGRVASPTGVSEVAARAIRPRELRQAGICPRRS